MKQYLDASLERFSEIFCKLENLCQQLYQLNKMIVNLNYDTESILHHRFNAVGFQQIKSSLLNMLPSETTINGLLSEANSLLALFNRMYDEQMWFCHPHMMPDIEYLEFQLNELENRSAAIRDMFYKIGCQVTEVYPFATEMMPSNFLTKNEMFYSCWRDEWKRLEALFAEWCADLFPPMHEWVELLLP